MAFGSTNPTRDQKYSNQKELVNVTEDEFSILIDKPILSWKQRVFQICSFFLFLGPIRLVVGCILFFGACFMIASIRWFVRTFKLDPETGKYTCYFIGKIGFRFLFFSLGIVWVKTNGKLDEEARFVIANHTAVCDPFVILMYMPVTPVIKAEVKKVKFLEHILENVDPIYVERDKPHGYTKELLARADNPIRFPVMTFPEGTIAGGEYMLKFHKGAFCSDYKVQPICIRYCMPLVPRGMAYYTFKRFSIYEHIWQMVSMPPSYLTVDFLPTMTLKETGEGSVDKFALNAELIMANHLQLRATSRSSNELYRKKAELKEKDKIKQAEAKKNN